MKKIAVLCIILISLILTGCSYKGQNYIPNYNTINELKDKNLKQVDVIRMTSPEDKTISISIGRGTNKMHSPYMGTFSKYLEIALEEELKQASIYNNKSNIKIKTKLLTNKIDTGISLATVDLSANFTILIDKEKVFTKIYEIHHEWESSFIGAIAIPRTFENYPIAMQKLIDEFLLDDEVINIIKK